MAFNGNENNYIKVDSSPSLESIDKNFTIEAWVFDPPIQEDKQKIAQSKELNISSQRLSTEICFFNPQEVYAQSSPPQCGPESCTSQSVWVEEKQTCGWKIDPCGGSEKCIKQADDTYKCMGAPSEVEKSCNDKFQNCCKGRKYRDYTGQSEKFECLNGRDCVYTKYPGISENRCNTKTITGYICQGDEKCVKGKCGAQCGSDADCPSGTICDTENCLCKSDCNTECPPPGGWVNLSPIEEHEYLGWYGSCVYTCIDPNTSAYCGRISTCDYVSYVFQLGPNQKLTSGELTIKHRSPDSYCGACVTQDTYHALINWGGYCNHLGWSGCPWPQPEDPESPEISPGIAQIDTLFCPPCNVSDRCGEIYICESGVECDSRCIFDEEMGPEDCWCPGGDYNCYGRQEDARGAACRSGYCPNSRDACCNYNKYNELLESMCRIDCWQGYGCPPCDDSQPREITIPYQQGNYNIGSNQNGNLAAVSVGQHLGPFAAYEFVSFKGCVEEIPTTGTTTGSSSSTTGIPTTGITTTGYLSTTTGEPTTGTTTGYLSTTTGEPTTGTTTGYLSTTT
ncbi:MAG: hypothetical protein PHQ76_04050, partial [Caldisericia bacterium]|nr:hypothetical protein [Caldisericia bacterium]